MGEKRNQAQGSFSPMPVIYANFNCRKYIILVFWYVFIVF